MTSQKRDPHRHSDKHWPSLLEVARTLYGSAQFAISSARRLSVFRSVPVSKFEERPGKYNSRFEYAQARGNSSTTRPNLFYNCLAFAKKHQMFQGGFDDNFSGHPENWLSASRRWGVENNENSQNAQGWRLSLPQAKGNVWNRLRFLKKHFMFLEELNRRIRENGINLTLSCIYLFQHISRLPNNCHKTQRTSLSFRISLIYLVTQTTFSGILESLSHSSQLQRLLFTISRYKYAKKTMFWLNKR